MKSTSKKAQLYAENYSVCQNRWFLAFKSQNLWKNNWKLSVSMLMFWEKGTFHRFFLQPSFMKLAINFESNRFKILCKHRFITAMNCPRALKSGVGYRATIKSFISNCFIGGLDSFNDWVIIILFENATLIFKTDFWILVASSHKCNSNDGKSHLLVAFISKFNELLTTHRA